MEARRGETAGYLSQNPPEREEVSSLTDLTNPSSLFYTLSRSCVAVEPTQKHKRDVTMMVEEERGTGSLSLLWGRGQSVMD